MKISDLPIIKFLINQYHLNTPKKIKHIAYSFIATASSIQLFPIIHEYKRLDLGIALVAMIFYLISEFLSEDKK